LRQEIEGLGILVNQAPLALEDEARGFAMLNSEPFLILISKRDGFDVSHAPRIFTLMHEFAHILLRDGSMCNDDHQSRSRQEIFCNKFASQFLLPPDEFKGAYREVLAAHADWTWVQKIESLRNRFKISFDAVAWRFKELSLLTSDEVEAAIAEWRKIQSEKQAPHYIPPAQVEGLVKAAYGETFTKKILNASTTPVEVAGILNINLDQLDKVIRAFR
jgi:Zn-dependent peptidase ImmA (M78 family)